MDFTALDKRRGAMLAEPITVKSDLRKLGVRPQIINALFHVNVLIIQDLLEFGPDNLPSVPNMGITRRKELVEALDKQLPEWRNHNAPDCD